MNLETNRRVFARACEHRIREEVGFAEPQGQADNDLGAHSRQDCVDRDFDVDASEDS